MLQFNASVAYAKFNLKVATERRSKATHATDLRILQLTKAVSAGPWRICLRSPSHSLPQERHTNFFTSLLKLYV